MTEEFQLIKSLQLKESSDHNTILLLNEGNPLCQPLPYIILDEELIFLCRIFQIQYQKDWSYGGDQIHIPKYEVDLK